jgi:predicted outer membrane protein
MQKNKSLKGLLAVSAVAAMFGAVGAQAQTAATGQNVGQNATGTGTGSQTMPNKSGKTNSTGAMGNSNSTGMESRPQTGSAMGSSGQSGMSSSSGAKLSSGDEKILKDMAMADMAEVEGGKLAQSKSQNADVKSFAQQMIDDHSQNLTQVQALAQARGVTLPTEPDAKHKAMAAKLEKLSGDAFDKAYMKDAGVQDHKAVHAKLMTAAKKAKDPELKALVEKTEPVVAQHLKSAEQMAMNKSGTTSGK